MKHLSTLLLCSAIDIVEIDVICVKLFDTLQLSWTKCLLELVNDKRANEVAVNFIQVLNLLEFQQQIRLRWWQFMCDRRENEQESFPPTKEVCKKFTRKFNIPFFTTFVLRYILK